MIKIIDLHKRFDEKIVLSGLNLTVNRGESMVVIGGSGTGKSVLIKHIIRIMEPDEGRIIVDGRDISQLRGENLIDFRKKFGMLFQGGALFDSMNVRDNVAFALMEHTSLRPSEIDDIVEEKLNLVGLRGVTHLWPVELSGGMKKRVALARAIAMEPEILLYDEPTTGLDPIRADAINELICDLNNRLKTTSIAITHDMTSANKIADRIAMLHEGKIIQVGSPREIENTENAIVRQFVTGSSHGPIEIG